MPKKEVMSFSLTPELCARLRDIPDGLRSIQVEEAIRREAGMTPLLSMLADAEELKGNEGEGK